MKEKKILTNRRKFLKNTALITGGVMIVPRHVLGGVGYTAPSDRLNIAMVGAGGRGQSVLGGLKDQNIIALCDVDTVRAAGSAEKHEKATFYKDFRVMLDKEKDLDAVMVCTPDHTHAPVAIDAMQRGKHVYVEKPLAHNIYEARKMRKLAQKKNLITQMGNQGASGEGTRLISEWIKAGLIGEVKTVHCWTNRPIWPQGVPTPTGEHKIPDNLSWDLWLGPAAHRAYNPAYLPFKWRGWWDFGTGALGDMGCHIMEPPVAALNLGYPESVEASVGQVYVGDFVEAEYDESCPPSSKVHFYFPARKEMPPVELVWYDGGILPKRPKELELGESMGQIGGGCIFEGTKGKIMCGVYGKNPTLLPTKRMKEDTLPEPTLKRVKVSHPMNWVQAIQNKTKASSDFETSGILTEIVLMGNLAIRSFNTRVLKKGKKRGDWEPFTYPGRTLLHWDGPNMKITNFDLANQFVKREYRRGWEI